MWEYDSIINELLEDSNMEIIVIISISVVKVIK